MPPTGGYVPKSGAAQLEDAPGNTSPAMWLSPSMWLSPAMWLSTTSWTGWSGCLSWWFILVTRHEMDQTHTPTVYKHTAGPCCLIQMLPHNGLPEQRPWTVKHHHGNSQADDRARGSHANNPLIDGGALSRGMTKVGQPLTPDPSATGFTHIEQMAGEAGPAMPRYITGQPLSGR